MTTMFGSAARAPLTSPRPRVTTEDLTRAITRYAHPTVAVVADLARGQIRVTEHGATTTHPLSDLTAQMTRARITPAGIDDAFATWIEHRPVTATEAREHGHLVLDWADPAQTILTWVVAVPRPRSILARFETPLLPAADLAAIRANATERSQDLPVEATTSGAIRLLSTDPVTLSTAALTRSPAPDPDLLLVITPGAPVAQGTPDAIRRLAQETNQPHTVVRPTQVPLLRP